MVRCRFYAHGWVSMGHTDTFLYHVPDRLHGFGQGEAQVSGDGVQFIGGRVGFARQVGGDRRRAHPNGPTKGDFFSVFVDPFLDAGA